MWGFQKLCYSCHLQMTGDLLAFLEMSLDTLDAAGFSPYSVSLLHSHSKLTGAVSHVVYLRNGSTGKLRWLERERGVWGGCVGGWVVVMQCSIQTGWWVYRHNGCSVRGSGTGKSCLLVGDCRADILVLTCLQRQCPFWKLVSVFDSGQTYPLICALCPSVSPSPGQSTPQMHFQDPPSSHVLLLKSQPYTTFCFWISKSFFPEGLWDTFRGLHGTVCIKLYHSGTVWILSGDYQLFEYSKWVLPAALIHQHSSFVSISSLSEMVFNFLSLFKLTDTCPQNLLCLLCFFVIIMIF